MYVCTWQVEDRAKENVSICALHEAIEREWWKCVCVCGGDSSAVLCVMYHVPDCVAAAVTSKNKGVFMSSLTDLVFINVLPPFLPITISFHTSTPPSPHYISSKRRFGDHTDFFCICHKPFNIHTHTHARTHAQTVQGSCMIPDLAGASLKCAMYSPRLDEAHRQTFIPTWLPLSFPPRAIYTVEKVNCLKHQRCYFSWFQKHCIWY